jgi:hypothetical protein
VAEVKGKTMLNRTLSANLNGLNLGTRTLATLNVAALNVVSTQRFRHDHPQMRKDSMRVAEMKLREDSSIRPSIRGFLPSFGSAGSPAFSPVRPYPGRPGEARPGVVVASTVEACVSAAWPSRASWAAWSQAQAQFCAQAWTAMNRAESIPAASFAAGG